MILLEIEGLPDYKEQLSLQVTKEGNGGEGRLKNLTTSEKTLLSLPMTFPTPIRY